MKTGDDGTLGIRSLRYGFSTAISVSKVITLGQGDWISDVSVILFNSDYDTLRFCAGT